MHPNQLTISAQTVRRLVDAQFPRWNGLPIQAVTSAGTVNAIFRVGDVALRFQLHPGDPDAVRRVLEHEHACANEFLGSVPFPAPEPIAIGEPGEGYPLPWSVQTWLEGDVATPTVAAGSRQFADDLAALIAAMRAVDTRGRPFKGAGRGGARGSEFASQDRWVATCLDRCEGLLDVPPLRRLWARLRELPAADSLAMTHGDLTPLNLLVRDGRLAGILDTGDFGPADPALDLICAWHLLEAGPRQTLRETLGCGDAEWERGMAWAFCQAMGLPWYYERSNPVMAELGKSTLRRILASQ